MKIFEQITDATSPYIELVKQLSSTITPTPDLGNVDEIIAYLGKIDNALAGQSGANSLTAAKKKAVEKVMSSLNLDKDDIAQAKEYWSLLSRPIGEVNEIQSWDIDWDTSHNISDNASLTLSAAAEGSTTFQVVSSKDSLTDFSIKVSDTDVLINHELKASIAVAAGANMSFNYGSIGVDTSAEAAAEFDSFYQVNASTPAASVVLDYFGSAFKVWDIDDVNRTLVKPNANDSANGLRMISMYTEGKFKLSGELKLGKAWSLDGVGGADEVSASINANIGFSRAFEHSGQIKLSFEKSHSLPDNSLLVSVELGESQTNSRALSLDVNAEIKGLDKLADKYIGQIFDKGDELVADLEKWSNPAEQVIHYAERRLSDDKWYKPVAQLVLGTAENDEAVKALIDQELANILDKYAQSPNVDPQKLAKQAMNKLGQVFSFDPAQAQYEKYVTKAEKELADKLADWSKSAKKEMTDKLKGLELKAKEKLLSPLNKLGEKTTELVRETDAKITERVMNAVAEYQKFKEKLTKQLEKAANIKLGLAVLSTSEDTESETTKFTIEILNTSHALAQKLFTSLVLGNAEKSARLLDVMDKQGIAKVRQQSTGINLIDTRTLSLSFDLGELSLSHVRNIASELNVTVSNTGDVAVSSNTSVTDTSTGFGEVRKASSSLTYGVAQTGLASESGNLGVSYVNSDSRVHKNSELRELLESLDLSENRGFMELDITPPDLIDEAQISSHLKWFKNTKSTAKITSSSVDITIPTSPSMYHNLMSASPELAYANACQYWFCLAVSKKDRKQINELLVTFAEVMQCPRDLPIILDEIYERTQFSSMSTQLLLEKTKVDRLKIMKLNKAKLRRQIGLLRGTYEKGNSFRDIILALGEIDDAILLANTQDGSNQEVASTLAKELAHINKRVENYLNEWTSVKNAFWEFFSSGIASPMLCFYLLLAKTAGKEEGFIRSVITLIGKDDKRYIRIVK